MNNNFTIKKIDTEYVNLSKVISYSVGNASPYKAATIFKNYKNNENSSLLGAICNNKLLGVIGFELLKENVNIKQGFKCLPIQNGE